MLEVGIYVIMRLVLVQHKLLLFGKVCNSFFLHFLTRMHFEGLFKRVLGLDFLVFNIGKYDVRHVVTVPRLGDDLEVWVLSRILVR